MKPLVVTATIAAPIERVFALSTRVELVRETLGMDMIAGPGLVSAGHVTAKSRVHWRGRKFGIMTDHHTLITAFEPPKIVALPSGPTKAAFFQDTQESGRFASFHHDHYFRESVVDGVTETVLRDEIYYAMPWGLAGRLVGALVMTPHILMLAKTRFALLRELAEGEGWRAYHDALPSPEA